MIGNVEINWNDAADCDERAKTLLVRLVRLSGEDGCTVAAQTLEHGDGGDGEPTVRLQMIALGVRRGQIRVAGDPLEWIHNALDALSASIASFETTIAVDAVNLPAWEHSDPSDRIIVATARQLVATLVTADTAILDYAAATKAVKVIEP